MNIGIVTWAGCVRCIKECRMLAEAGHTLWLFSNAKPDIDDKMLAETFFMWNHFTDQQSLYNKLIGLDFLDLVHVHNEPSWMVNVSKKAGHITVLDAHDLNIVRYGWDKAREMKSDDIPALIECDGLIVPCDKYIDIIKEEAEIVIPTMTLYSYVNKADFTRIGEGELINQAIVYQGSIYAPRKNHPLPYRIYDNVAKKMVEMGIPFHIYPGRGYVRHMPYYQSIGCVTHDPQSPQNLLKSLSKYKYGFCGSPIKHRQWDNTMSNKLFDYLAAGIPPIVFQAEQSEKFVKEHKCGMVIGHLDQLKGMFHDQELFTQYKIKVLDIREKSFTMESQLTKLEDFYEQVITH